MRRPYTHLHLLENNMSSSVRVYYEADTERARLHDRVFTIIGYGSQGHAHAQKPARLGGAGDRGAAAGRRILEAAVADGLEVRPVARPPKRVT